MSNFITQTMRIAHIAPLWVSVPPATYGGTELQLHWLVEGLFARGHEITLFSSGDSRTRAKLRYKCDRNLLDMMARGEAMEYDHYVIAQMADVLAEADSFDVINCHLGCRYVPISQLSKTPVLHRINHALTLDDLWSLQKYADAPVSAISHSQVDLLPLERRETISVIYNGVDFDQYEYSETPGKHLAFLGRMGPQKNPVGAIRIAQKVGVPIVLAGTPQNGAEKRYFESEIKPLIDGKDVIYVGPVHHHEKVELLRNACALLFPIQWEEPFGIVIAESMACGTPVLACDKGSVGEVIDYGITGYFADDVEDLPALVPSTLSLDRRRVREHALGRFSHHRMVDQYLSVYESLVFCRRWPIT